MLAVEAPLDQAAADQRQAIRAPRQVLYVEQGAQVPCLGVALGEWRAEFVDLGRRQEGGADDGRRATRLAVSAMLRAFPTSRPGACAVRYSDPPPRRNAMNDLIRPTSKPALVSDPNARKDAEEPELDDRKPGEDENAAGFLKNAIDKPAEE